MKRTFNKRFASKVGEYRSGLERKVRLDLDSRGISYGYEVDVISYQRKPSKYHPDLTFERADGSKFYVEIKGYFEASDRTKHLLIKEQHPDVDVRFVFQNPHNLLRKGSPTTYAMWCDKHDFPWAAKVVPQEWIDEAA